MNTLIVLGLLAMVIVAWFAVKSARSTSNDLIALDRGDMFDGFKTDSRIQYGEKILALDRGSRAVVLVGCSYWAPHPTQDEDYRFSTKLRLNVGDIKCIEADGWEDGKPRSAVFQLNRPIPGNNTSLKLSISGHPDSIGPFLTEVGSCLSIPVRLEPLTRGDA